MTPNSSTDSATRDGAERDQMLALIEKHLGLRPYRNDCVINNGTGRWTDAARYYNLMNEWADARDAASRAEVERLRADQQGLLKLARYGAAMLHWHRGDNPSECGDVDAITCQEEAIRCGVLEGRNVDEPCGEGCVCAPFVGWEVCYFVPDDVRISRAALSTKKD